MVWAGPQSQYNFKHTPKFKGAAGVENYLSRQVIKMNREKMGLGVNTTLRWESGGGGDYNELQTMCSLRRGTTS